jgi:surfactin synthase thioesterase subunit
MWDLEYNAFIKELEDLNGTPKEILSNPELMELIIPLLRADFKVAETYLGEAVPIKIPALVLKGEDEEDLTLEKALAWRDIFTEKCEVKQVPGDHFFIDQHPHIVIKHVLSIVKLVLGNVIKAPEKELTRLN